MFIVSPTTVLNASALDTKQVPKRLIGRVAPVPKRAITAGTLARLVFEMQLLRYLGALVPFVIAMLIWRDLALPISQAPLLMFLVLWLVEQRLLSVPRERRPALADEAEAARVLDLLRYRATEILGRIAARRDIGEGRLHLVVEQSELARIAPLTLVSVQHDGARPALLSLDAAERAIIEDELFDAAMSEERLHRVNMAQSTFLRDVGFDPRSVSAHARLAALAAG